ncbi:FkbM family methyltransferase [Flavobacteriaceae bacterium]|nr:FkbM family methyltransferase [Flavobacteriaceae bacterium]
MVTINKLKEKYLRGKLSKLKFVTYMNDKFKILEDFHKNIGETPINEIKISKNGVVFYINVLKKEVKFYMDPNDIRESPKEIFNFNNYEYYEILLLTKIIDKCQVIFDIGANIGWYSVYLDKFEEVNEIHSFEPMPINFNKLKANLELNNSTKVLANNFGLSDSNEFMKMYYNSSLTGATSIKQNIEICNELIECQFKKMDDYVLQNGINRIDFIKMDIEGAELLALKGALNSIRNFLPILFLELTRKWSINFNYHPNDVINLLKDLGYSCYSIGKTLIKIDSITDETIETNFYFFHDSKHNEVLSSLK